MSYVLVVIIPVVYKFVFRNEQNDISLWNSGRKPSVTPQWRIQTCISSVVDME